MTPDLPRRVADGANTQAWRERAERAAQLTRERTGIPVEPLPVMGGLWAPLEAVETWLGIDFPGTPPLLPEPYPSELSPFDSDGQDPHE